MYNIQQGSIYQYNIRDDNIQKEKIQLYIQHDNIQANNIQPI